MYCEAGPQFRLKPCGLRRHDVSAVSDVGKLFHGNRIQSESNLHFTIVNTTGEFTETSDTADEVNAFVSTEILDSQYLVKNEIREDSNIENTDRIFIIISSRLSLK